jgi:starvation-inducible DNA-binding protein
MTTTHTKTPAKLYATRNDLPESVRASVISLLAATLATTLDLKTQIKQAHWTVKGLDFFQLHNLFDEMATEMDDYVDLVAERITALGGTPLGTARIAAAQSILSEYPLDSVQGIEHITALADRYGDLARHLRTGINDCDDFGDKDTADLYTEVSRAIDKRLWFLEAHLA